MSCFLKICLSTDLSRLFALWDVRALHRGGLDGDRAEERREKPACGMTTYDRAVHVLYVVGNVRFKLWCIRCYYVLQCCVLRWCASRGCTVRVIGAHRIVDTAIHTVGIRIILASPRHSGCWLHGWLDGWLLIGLLRQRPTTTTNSTYSYPIT